MSTEVKYNWIKWLDCGCKYSDIGFLKACSDGHKYLEGDMVDGQPLKTGQKNDQGKPPIALIWPEAIEAEAAVMGLGEEKYGTWNWTNGLSVLRVASALLRHTYAFLRGEDLDPESGQSHMAHVRCCAAFIIFYMKYRRDLDDRYKGHNKA